MDIAQSEEFSDLALGQSTRRTVITDCFHPNSELYSVKIIGGGVLRLLFVIHNNSIALFTLLSNDNKVAVAVVVIFVVAVVVDELELEGELDGTKDEEEEEKDILGFLTLHLYRSPSN
jgi:hypothetical protein